jgi:single-strand DNA-binding protein
MSTLRNKVTLLGNAGMQPEIKSFDKDKKVAKLSLAVNESRKNDKGEWVNNTTWFNLVAWNGTAGFIERNVQKGYELMVEGKLVNKSYDAKDGTKRYITEIEVSDLMIVNKRTNSNS